MYIVLSNCLLMKCEPDLIRSTLLREHFKKVHGSGKYKDTTLDELKRKRAQFDVNAIIPSYGFVPV